MAVDVTLKVNGIKVQAGEYTSAALVKTCP